MIVLLSICGFVAEKYFEAIQIGVLLLLVAAIFLTDEQTRLLAYGVIVSGTFSFAVAVAPREFSNYVPLTVAGVLLLRWIPFSEVFLWREIVVMIGVVAVLISGGLKPAPTQIIAALTIALVTPIFPARMLLFPFLVVTVMAIPIARLPIAAAFLIAAFYARYSIAVLCVGGAIALIINFRIVRMPAYACAVALFALWPWSGIAARAFPAVIFAELASTNSRPVWIAIGRAQSVSIDVPPAARTMVITASAANASRLPVGRVVGWAEGGERRTAIRIGDIADFGFTRREHFFASRNRPPSTPLDDIKGYGAAAWLHTAGRMRISLGKPASSLRIAAAPDLPPEARLQIEAVEFE